MKRLWLVRAIVVGLACLFGGAANAAQSTNVRNVIVLVADGAGYNTLEAVRMWHGGALPQDGPAWESFPMATYALRQSDTVPAGREPRHQDPEIVYDPAKAWDTTPLPGTSEMSAGYPAAFEGYEWLRRTAPDSANTMSAMMTGVRTYRGAINVDGAGEPVLSLAETAASMGKAVGTVSSVPFNHATPAAGGGAHARDRDELHTLAYQLFGIGVLDVIGGAGNPDYDDNGRRAGERGYERPANPHEYMPADLWQDLQADSNDSRANPGWTLVQSRKDIRSIADGTTSPPEKLAMIPPVFATLQQRRDYPPGQNKATYAPYDAPFIESVPRLAEMTRAALSVVGRDEDGFFLVVESGAIDWAMHANELGRMIEEYDAFTEALAAIIEYIENPETGANWENTLLVVTADHDHLLFGPEGDRVPFQPLEDRGAGRLPGHMWLGNGHGNQLVALFIRGRRATEIADLADQTDRFDDGTRVLGRGAYLTQPDLGRFVYDVMTAPASAASPETIAPGAGGGMR